jgi:CHASE2 domain
MHSKGWRVRPVAIAFIAVLIPFVMNEWFGASFHKSNAWYLRIISPDYWYRKYAPGPDPLQMDAIRIVSIARGNTPGAVLGHYACTHREFMAKLLNKLATINLSVVVIDKWYNPLPSGVCPPGTDGTPKLRDAIRNLSAKTKVVIAVESYRPGESSEFCTESQSKKLHPEQVVLTKYEPLLDFGPLDAENNDPDGRVRWGLARINSQVRKIPLGWMAYQDCNQIATAVSTMMPTLSTAAAMLVDKTIMQGHHLADLESAVTHPYTKLVPEGFRLVPAIQLICDQPSDTADWRNCASGEHDAKALASLAGRKIIIGETTEADSFETDEGPVKGPILQANYLASMLSDKSILSPVPDWVNNTISLAWLFLVFLVFYWWLKNFPALAALVSLLFTVALCFLFSAVITRQFGVFADVLPPTILEIIGLYLARTIELLLEHRQPEKVRKERHERKVRA